jgi:hypothetical protein
MKLIFPQAAARASSIGGFVEKETTNPDATWRSKQKLNKVGPLIPVKQKQLRNVLPLSWMHTRERTRKLQEHFLVHTAAYASTTSKSATPCAAATSCLAALALHKRRRVLRLIISRP